MRHDHPATRSLSVLFPLIALAIGLPQTAGATAGPRDYEGPTDVEPPTTTPPAPPAGDETKPAEPKQPEVPDGVKPDVEDGEGGVVFVIEDVKEGEGEGDGFTDESGEGEGFTDESGEGEGEGFGEDGECGDDGFCFEDLSEDEEALAAEAEVEIKQVKGPSGSITGVLKDSTSGSPLIGATVRAINTKYSAETNINGEYTLNIPPGSYTLEISGDGYKPTNVENVVIEKDKEVKVSDELEPFGALTVVVEGEINKESAAGKLVERKKSAAARDMMSREDISRSGGGSTSSVARRIVGSTVVEGRYLFVRGLGHRYGNTLFDGARVPSPNPNNRSVPLDIVPTSALGAINVQKTATPDVPADFAGASAQLESRNPPDELSWSLGASVGGNTATTFREGIQGTRFAGDNVAFGNLSRQLAPAYDTPVKIDHTVDGGTVWSNEQIRDFGLGMPTTETEMTPYTAIPNFGASGSVGGTVHPWGTDLGLLASVGYGHSTQTVRPTIKAVNRPDCGAEFIPGSGPCPLSPDKRTLYLNSIKTNVGVRWSAVALAKWKTSENDTISLLGLYTRDSDNETRRLGNFEGDSYAGDLSFPRTNTRHRYQLRSILLTRLGGKHTLPKANDFTIDWFGSYAQAREDTPLLREMLFDETAGGSDLIADEGGKFQYMDLVDNNGTGAIDFTAPFTQWSKLDAKVKFGGRADYKVRTFTSRLFRYTPNTGAMRPTGGGNILNEDTIGGPFDDSIFYLREQTRPEDSYLGTQGIYAGYAMLDLPFVRWFRLAGGARFEANRINLDVVDQFTGEVLEDNSANVTDNNVLPSLAMIFAVRSDMNLRLAGYQTVARPEFRELASFRFTDFAGGFDVVGERNLVSSKIWNGDARYEWFPSAGEVVAVSGFFKYFIDPIEAYAAAGSYTKSFQNAKSAYNAGGEIELRKNLEFVHKGLRDLSLGFNFAYIYSRVTIRTNEELVELGQPESTQSNSTRPLQGQAPFVLNAFIDYNNKKSGTGLRVLFNTHGSYISFVGARGLDDIYRSPVHTLDFVGEQRLYKGLGLSLKVGNILNWQTQDVQSGEPVYFIRKGVNVSLGLKYSY